MRHQWRGGVLFLLLSAVLVLQGEARQAPALAGVYLVEGVNPDHSPYTGVVELVAQGEQWQLTWSFEPAGEAVGIGVLQGDVHAEIFQTDGGMIGLASYVVDRASTPLRLKAHWIIPGVADVLSETLTKTTVTNPALLRGPRLGV